MDLDQNNELFIVRHGATKWSVSGQHTGRTDIELVSQGREEAERAGVILAGKDFSAIFTSPLQRAFETCKIAGFGNDAVVSDDLVEWDYGDFEGLTTDEIRKSIPEWTLWTHGVPGGESAAEVGRRVDRVIAAARANSGRTLCFAHGHVLRVLAARWLGLPPSGGRLFGLDSGSVSVLGWERSDAVIRSWNLVTS